MIISTAILNLPPRIEKEFTLVEARLPGEKQLHDVLDGIVKGGHVAIEARLGAVAIDRREQDFSGAAVGGFAGPLDGVPRGAVLPAPGVHRVAITGALRAGKASPPIDAPTRTDGHEVRYREEAPLVPAICPVVVLQGSHRDMGRQYAKQVIDIYGPWIFAQTADPLLRILVH